MTRHLVLDNEAVHALLSRRQHDRRRAAVVEAVMAADGVVAVPTAVRGEAGWRRTDPRAALANRLVRHDLPLDAPGADRIVELRRAVSGASVVDASIAVAAERVSPDRGDVVEVLTSDVDDLTALAGHVTARIVVVGLR